MQLDWIGEVEKIRRSKPDLDLVLTHVDDRVDSGMRDAIGADSAEVLPLLDSHDFTFLVEDPATVWNLGPERYLAMAEKYHSLTRHISKLAVDINVVERYQDVYPTKQQTGTELFQLVHGAAAGFPRVALYFENSLLPPDLPLLPAAAARAIMEQRGEALVVESQSPVGLNWRGPAMVDGKPWPAWDGETIWLPAGTHIVTAGTSDAARLLRLNGDLLSAGFRASGEIEFQYAAGSRAIARFDRKVRSVQLDGREFPAHEAGPNELFLPRGQHFVTMAFD